MAEGVDDIETRDYSDLPPVEIVAPATIGAAAILLIVLGSIAACVIAIICITTGGVLIARKATYKVDQNDISGEIVEMVAVPKGQEFVPDDEWVTKRMSQCDMVGFNPMNRHLGPRSSAYEAGKARNAIKMRGSQLTALRAEMSTLGEMAFADHDATDVTSSSEDFVNPMLMMATLNSSGRGQPHGKEPDGFGANSVSKPRVASGANPMHANSTQRAPESYASPLTRGVQGSAPGAQGADSYPAAGLGLEAKKSMRVDRDGSVHSKDDFRKYYGGEDEWNAAMRTGAGGAARHAIAQHAFYDEDEVAPGSPRFDFGRLAGRGVASPRPVPLSGAQSERSSRSDVGGGNRGTMPRKQSLRTDVDGTAYTRAQFAEHYGGEDEWNAARRPSGSRSGSRSMSPVSDEAPGRASPELEGEDALSGKGHVDGDVELLLPDGESSDSAAAALSPPPHGESDDAPQSEAVDSDGLSEHGTGEVPGEPGPTMAFDL
jgi:hypothetical protein